MRPEIRIDFLGRYQGNKKRKKKGPKGTAKNSVLAGQKTLCCEVHRTDKNRVYKEHLSGRQIHPYKKRCQGGYLFLAQRRFLEKIWCFYET